MVAAWIPCNFRLIQSLTTENPFGQISFESFQKSILISDRFRSQPFYLILKLFIPKGVAKNLGMNGSSKLFRPYLDHETRFDCQSQCESHVKNGAESTKLVSEEAFFDDIVRWNGRKNVAETLPNCRSQIVSTEAPSVGPQNSSNFRNTLSHKCSEQSLTLM